MGEPEYGGGLYLPAVAVVDRTGYSTHILLCVVCLHAHAHDARDNELSTSRSCRNDSYECIRMYRDLPGSQCYWKRTPIKVKPVLYFLVLQSNLKRPSATR